MRVGRNPNAKHEARGLEGVVLCVVTHLPSLQGYHAGRFEVIQTCLRTMRANAQMPHSMIIWDNESLPVMREWIRDEIEPDILVESRNVGKAFAKYAVANMLTSETVLAFGDDDMLYFPNWLRPQMDLLEHFPNVSVVSGYPIRTSFRWGCENTIRWAQENGELEAGRFMPEDWEREFAASIGRPWELHQQMTLTDNDYRVTYEGRQAYCTAHHCQFVGYAGRIGEIAYRDGMAMGDEKPFDIRADKMGLRLSTTQRLARHIGNVLDEDIRRNVEFIK